MTTYAHIVDGHTTNVVVTPPDLSLRFHPDWLAANPFVVVPDGTLHGARDNGDGTFSNPPAPAPPAPPELNATEQVNAMTRARAAELAREGKHAEALYLLLTIGV